MKKYLTIFLIMLPLTTIAAEQIPDKDYYNKLRAACRNNTMMGNLDECCQASVDQMEARNALLKDPVLTVECPAGYSKNMLKCISTYQWCEPNGINEPANLQP